jgi:hypothetical protein
MVHEEKCEAWKKVKYNIIHWKDTTIILYGLKKLFYMDKYHRIWYYEMEDLYGSVE